jgi:hypothetical protein
MLIVAIIRARGRALRRLVAALAGEDAVAGVGRVALVTLVVATALPLGLRRPR